MPWIISKIVGLFVGGHAFVVIGYDQGYNGQKVLILQNSYSSGWGDGGKFYMTEQHFVSECLNRYGCVVNLDEESISEPWVDEAKKLYDRVKDKYVFILRAEATGEMYELTETGVKYVPIRIGSERMIAELNSYLRSNEKFIGVSEKDFDLLTRYARLIGLKVGAKSV